MLIVGLTGGIGSGKSTVAELFAALGAPVIDADVIAREVLVHDKTHTAEIVARFGAEILNAQGELNRSKLRTLVFENPVQREWLEQLLHPPILDGIQQRLSKLNAPYCIVVIPLLTEVVAAQELVDRVLVVDVLEETQIARVSSRDKLTVAAVKKMMSSQASREQRLAIADDVLENEGDLETLERKVLALHDRYLNEC